jgi:beta-lactamase superfamily II metal-dependent hydrolase
MFVQIFDVNAGACALIRTDDGRLIMVDCGSNGTSGWQPGEYLRANGVSKLDLLVITNYDEDHLSGLPSLDRIDIGQIHRNRSLTPDQIEGLKDPDTGPGPGVARLISSLRHTHTTLVSDPYVASGFSYDVFYNTPRDVGYESNDLSLVMLARCHWCNILFPGDLECRGWEALARGDAKFLPALRSTHIMMAPHHGRENGQWGGFAQNTPQLHWVIISDKGYLYDTQKYSVPFYRALASGWKFDGEDRFVLTTRNEGSIHIEITQSGMSARCFDESY